MIPCGRLPVTRTCMKVLLFAGASPAAAGAADDRSRCPGAPRRAGARRFLGPGGLAAAAACAVLLAGCGSTHSTTAAAATCQQVGAVLSDGPDPGADPVGYALAQITPLREITTSDTTLRLAIDNLASAYQRFYDHDGVGRPVAQAVAKASHAINALCPGVAS